MILCGALFRFSSEDSSPHGLEWHFPAARDPYCARGSRCSAARARAGETRLDPVAVARVSFGEISDPSARLSFREVTQCPRSGDPKYERIAQGAAVVDDYVLQEFLTDIIDSTPFAAAGNQTIQLVDASNGAQPLDYE